MRILRDLLLFMSITASVSEETTVHACFSPLTIFGFEQTEMRSLMSSLEHGFENNRKVLGQLMKSMDFTVSLMDAVDIQTAKLKGIHDAFRSQAMKIPLLWEKNEILLRYLVAPQKMLITYAISHNQVNDLQQTVCEDRDDSTYQPNRSSNEGGHEALQSSREEKGRKGYKVPPPSYENLEQILVHLCRDWSPQGKLIRQRLYTEGIIVKVLENIPAVNTIDYGSSARNNEEYYYTEDETPCDRHSRNSPTSVISDSDSIQNSFEIAADLRLINRSEQAAEFQRNGRTKFDSSCHHEECSMNPSEELKNTKNKSKIYHEDEVKSKNQHKNQNKNKSQDQKKNQNNSVLRNSEGVRVLVPGAGLGRLASELAVLGYSVEANDCSGIMVAAMRSILEDILLNSSTDTDIYNDTDCDADKDRYKDSSIGKNSDSDLQSNTNTETHGKTSECSNTNTHNANKTRKSSDGDNINSSYDTQNSTSPLFEFYPHISPKLADNWDFKSTLEAATFPSKDSVNVAKWLKKRRKQDISQNCMTSMTSMPKSEEEDASGASETEQSGGRKVGCGSEGDRGECTAAIPEGHSPVLNPAPVPTSTPVPISVPTPIHGPTTNSTPTPVPTPAPTPVSNPTPEADSLHPLGSLSVQMGEFTKVYSHIDQENQFDCVVTCFFIDTASDILEYIAVIAHVLREGGVWVNAGPLHYHMRSTIQYSYAQIIEVIKLSGFDVVSQDVVRTTSYSGEDTYSMKPEYYTVPLDVFRLTRKEDKWPLNGHKKPDDPISDPLRKTAPFDSENHLKTQDEKRMKESEELHNVDESWIRSDFIIKN